MKKFIIAIAVMFTAFSALAEGPKVTTGFSGSTVGSEYLTVNVTSSEDNLVINKVTVNRGACNASVGNPSKSFTLPFGKTATWRFMTYNGINGSSYSCDIVEIVVDTNKGSWTYN